MLDGAWVLDSPDLKLRFSFHPEDEDYYLDVDYDFDPDLMDAMEVMLWRLGYELMPVEECEPDVFDFHFRRYAAKRCDVSPVKVLSLMCEQTTIIPDEDNDLLSNEYEWRVG